MPLTIALAQVRGSEDPETNLGTARGIAAQASESGAGLVVFPEMFMALPGSPSRLTDIAQSLDGPFVNGLRELAARHALFLAAGVWERLPGETSRVGNTAVLLSPDGLLLTVYRKIHLFDALGCRESRAMAPGDVLPEPVSVNGFKVGLAVCYDLRFPEIFRHLALAGADLILIPSAWYAGPLKEEHWLTLLKARAIENTVYAAGCNLAGDPFFGRSSIFDPFGVPLAGGGEGPDLILAEARLDRLREVRGKLPSLAHVRRDLFMNRRGAGS